MHLVIVDTTQIQSYVFGSNRLAENIGASQLVAAATNSWALQILPQPNNIKAIDPRRDTCELNKLQIKENSLTAEIIYAAGGNTLILFQEKGGDHGSDSFIRSLSKKALIDAPNLQLVIESVEFDWDTTSLSDVTTRAFSKLLRQKAERSLSVPLLGLSVTAVCQGTGLPANGKVREVPSDPRTESLASVEVILKGKAASQANKRLSAFFEAQLLDDQEPRNAFEFPRDFDQLGSSANEQSYIAIVHADGDGMGMRIQEIAEAYPAAHENRKYVNALREFSEKVAVASQGALASTIECLINCIQTRDGALLIPYRSSTFRYPGEANPDAAKAADSPVAPIELKKTQANYYLPFRPLVFGGDDVTWVCDGRVGISLAIEYLREFEKETEKLFGPGRGMTSCAGIVIVKSHYPFARAYGIAEALCHSAKQFRREILREEPAWNGSCLDWHFATTGLAASLAETRRREYDVKGNHLTLRPVALGITDGKFSFRSWQIVSKGLKEFQEGTEWSGKRNKVNALRDALRGGPGLVEKFEKHLLAPVPANAKKLPDVGFSFPHAWHLWSDAGGGYCGHFDAIELADLFNPLECLQVESARKTKQNMTVNPNENAT